MYSILGVYLKGCTVLKRLMVRNLAVVERLDVSFEPGFNVLSGETGSGKSVLVGALQLVLGGSARREMIRTGAPSAEVSAVFELEGRAVEVQRVVAARGRGRCLVDGESVRLATEGTVCVTKGD